MQASIEFKIGVIQKLQSNALSNWYVLTTFLIPVLTIILCIVLV